MRKKKAASLPSTLMGGEASFDKQTGRMRRFAYKGKDLLNPDPASGEKGFFPNIYRAPIDNDMNIRKSWEKAGYDCYEAELLSLRTKADTLVPKGAEQPNDHVTVETTLQLRAKGRNLFRVELIYTFASNGMFTLRARLSAPSDKKLKRELARFGVFFEMPEAFAASPITGWAKRRTCLISRLSPSWAFLKPMLLRCMKIISARRITGTIPARDG